MTVEAVERRVSLRGGARQAMNARDSEVLIAGPAGTGKSFGVLLKMHMMCMMNPGMRGLMVRKTHKSLTSTGLVTFREQVAKEAIERKICRWYGGSGEKPAQYIYDNGSVIVVGGLDNADKIMSAEYDMIFVQEATDLTRDDWEKCSSRLRNGRVSFQQLIGDCNPQQPTHWLKKRCDEGLARMLYSRHEDNPRLFTPDGTITEYGAAYIARLDALTGVRKERLRYGRWAAAEGVIYGDWSPDTHIYSMPYQNNGLSGLPLSWERVWAVDFGYTNPFVWQQWTRDPDGRLWLEREIYQTQRLVEDHAKSILKAVVKRAHHEAIDNGVTSGLTWKYPRPSAIICDHDAEDRATLERHLGMGTTAAQKTVSDGIQAMQARMRVQPDGKPRMLVLRDALVSVDTDVKGVGKPTCFAEEIEGYVWEPDPAGGRPNRDRPLKENDHAMDAARYVVAHYDLQARARVRWIN